MLIVSGLWFLVSGSEFQSLLGFEFARERIRNFETRNYKPKTRNRFSDLSVYAVRYGRGARFPYRATARGRRGALLLRLYPWLASAG
jgi:hypothetical protein